MRLPDVDHDPRKIARDARKTKMGRNERQHQQNLARAQGEPDVASSSVPGRELQSQRKKDIDKTLAVTRTSTASLGRFDRVLDGEKKLKGIKRKVRSVCTSNFTTSSNILHIRQFDPTEVSASSEKSHNLAILSKLDREPTTKKAKRSSESAASSTVLNVRKAVRHATKGANGAALRREVGGKGKKGKR